VVLDRYIDRNTERRGYRQAKSHATSATGERIEGEKAAKKQEQTTAKERERTEDN
jgi:hypothetical protein